MNAMWNWQGCSVLLIEFFVLGAIDNIFSNSTYSVKAISTADTYLYHDHSYEDFVAHQDPSVFMSHYDFAATYIPTFPSCAELDDFCPDIHLSMYEDIINVEDFHCMENDDCKGNHSYCDLDVQKCICSANRLGGSCGGMVLYSQKWRFKQVHNFSATEEQPIALSAVVPRDASDVVTQWLTSSLPLMTEYNIVADRMKQHTYTIHNYNEINHFAHSQFYATQGSPHFVPIQEQNISIPVEKILWEWFPSTTYTLDYLRELVEEWSLVQDVQRSERDQMTMEKIYAEVIFVVACLHGQMNSNNGLLSPDTVEISDIIDAAIDGIHNAVIWSMKNALRFYAVNSTSRSQVLAYGQAWYFELFKVFCYLPKNTSYFYIEWNLTLTTPSTNSWHGVKTFLLARAVRVGLSPVVKELLKLYPPQSMIVPLFKVATANNDLLTLHMLSDFVLNASIPFSVSDDNQVSTNKMLSARDHDDIINTSQQWKFVRKHNGTSSAFAIDMVNDSIDENVLKKLLGVGCFVKEINLESDKVQLPPIRTHQWSLQKIRQNFGNRNVSVARIPYANNFGLSEKEMTIEDFFSQYMDEDLTIDMNMNSTNETIITSRRSTESGRNHHNFPTVKNASDYVFDAAFLHDDMFVVNNCGCHGPTKSDCIAYSWLIDNNESSFCIDNRHNQSLGSMVQTYLTAIDGIREDQQLWHQWYLGPPASGAPLHFHCQAFNILTAGRKLWILVPPSSGVNKLAYGYSRVDSLTWIHDNIDQIASHPGLSVCLQNPGDNFFVPSFWSHATLNLETSTGFATEIYNAC